MRWRWLNPPWRQFFDQRKWVASLPDEQMRFYLRRDRQLTYMTAWVFVACMILFVVVKTVFAFILMFGWMVVQFYWRWRIEKKLGHDNPFSMFMN